MDLNQEKLTKTEWESTEVPISQDEKEIMNLIMTGYFDINHIYNKKQSILNYLRLVPNENLMEHIFKEYYKSQIEKINLKYNFKYEGNLDNVKFQRVNSTERVKLDNLSSKIKECQPKIFEYILLYIAEQLLKYNSKQSTIKFNKMYYTLFHLNNLKITNVIPKVRQYIVFILDNFAKIVNIDYMIKEASDLIENNVELFDYKDYKLYSHQKELFNAFKIPDMYKDLKKLSQWDDFMDDEETDNEDEDEKRVAEKKHIKQMVYRLMKPKLVFYTAPTGTGKTLSPIALANEYKIIFVCAARHVGLALAQTAISVGKKVAFAFGCHDVTDIRLHYNAAASYHKHEQKGSGTKCTCGRHKCGFQGQDIKYKDGKKKIDNSDGSNVEIMICDIKSYVTSMNYMCAFNKNIREMIMYWDEPTITLDYESHPHHEHIKRIWKLNIIPNIVLSSATLPRVEEIPETVTDFQSRFNNSSIINIVSHDCEKSIPIINSKNYVELPHLKYKDYNKLLDCVRHCRKHMSIIRYFDLKEIIKFITNPIVMTGIKAERKEELLIITKYNNITLMTMNNIKEHYLQLLENILPDQWDNIFETFQSERKCKYTSTINVATSDSYTLTDGPSIFLTENVDKICKFILQSAKIPTSLMNTIMESIHYNDKILQVICEKTKKMEDALGNEVEKEHKMSKDQLNPEAKKIKKEIDELSNLIKYIEFNDIYIPNKKDHLKRWTNKDDVSKEFTSTILPSDIEKIMLMDNVDVVWKLLLLMGIGVFSANLHKDYTEIMKTLAIGQKLFMIVADSDYIYGTNYQFCHGYLSKDLANMTQEKTIQAMGRMGRNNKHMDFSIRFRNDELINKIFEEQEDRQEVINMNNLFSVDLDDI
jgi:hypothetical protein